MSEQTKQLKHCLSNSGIEKDGSYLGVKLCSRKHKDTACPYFIPVKRYHMSSAPVTVMTVLRLHHSTFSTGCRKSLKWLAL